MVGAGFLLANRLSKRRFDPGSRPTTNPLLGATHREGGEGRACGYATSRRYRLQVAESANDVNRAPGTRPVCRHASD
ncbi:uncharacterized protein KIAA0947 isoform X1 [Anopheles sinensis]|uniref:Uncharacterized protein KIAA0947 isoform X1 n=1 Tax=Anopheles sinensis TaxID=74873 RepID=A0A084VV59_ANOSI|nr:uncharacterized protein KIAA0947 isoform X1 [Anopheles sinensis]